jgi:arylsulfatase
MPIQPVSRRGFFKSAALGSVVTAGALAQSRSPQPNVVLIVADDLGYGDLNCYGSSIPTPKIDSLAREGVQFTQYYAASPVCSPSRASLLTGRYAPRTGVPYVLQASDTHGLLNTEVTMAQMLKGAGYRTMCVGKWHLGSLPQFMPNSKGFDEFYGVPYSIDMSPLPLMQNTNIIEEPANLNTLTERYTQQAVNFISNSQKKPFFLYLAHSFPHIPVATSEAFKGITGKGKYADTIAEIDASVGSVLQALQSNNIDNNTLVIFSSDHGPWYQGSSANLRGRKGETFDGGMRVPFVARFPGSIPAGQVNSTGIATALDLMPTVASLTGAALPANPMDGVNIWPMLTGTQDAVARDAFLYIDTYNIQAARLGPWKLHVARYNTPPWVPLPKVGRTNLPLANPELYNILNDPGESSDVAQDYPQIVAEIQARINSLLPQMPSQVQSAWKTTTGTPVQWNAAGAWPVEAESSSSTDSRSSTEP